MTSRKTPKGIFAALALITVSLFAAPAFAIPELGFDQGGAPSGGFIYWTGNAADPLVGAKISFFNISPTDTPLNAGRPPLTCFSCLLNFETGAFDGTLGPFETFKGGGSFTLTGGVSADGGGAPAFGGLPLGSTILDGDFSNIPGQVVFSRPGGTFTGAGTDLKHEDLVAYYGLGPDFKFTETSILGTLIHEGVGTVDLFDIDPLKFADDEVEITFSADGFLFLVSNADIRNSPLPEPGTTALFLLGLTGLAAARRRKS